jgi:hypothetical protein
MSVECGKLMINAIKEEINVILHKIYGYPELFAKIGIDPGENAIVQFGYEHLSPIDVLGYTMNIASKITSLTGANEVSIGENVYKSLDRKVQKKFHELSISDGILDMGYELEMTCRPEHLHLGFSLPSHGSVVLKMH